MTTIVDVKTQDIRHVQDFLYINIFIQHLLAKNIIFLIHEKPTVIVNSIDVRRFWSLICRRNNIWH